MTSEEKMREEFEAWISERHEGCIYTNCGLDRVVSDDRYCSMEIEWAWRSWKGSRESLVIELPDEITCDDGYPSDDWLVSNAQNSMLERCRSSIKSAGVKTK